jgi:Trypsin-like peptidase domain
MSAINTFGFVFPLFTGPGRENPELIVGAAFGLGDDFFLTAAHCVKPVGGHKWIGLGILDQGAEFPRIVDVSDAECDESCDLGVFKCQTGGTHKRLHWSDRPLLMGGSVNAVGYAYGFDSDGRGVTGRTFSGTVVASRPFRRLRAEPPAYEVSFPCPRGLSGAPLLSEGLAVSGVVLGNQTTEMMIYASRERVSPEREHVVERFEPLALGVAIQSRAVLELGLSFKILGGMTLREHLERSDLIATGL